MFDVTDLEKPKEMFKTVIGDRGTYSELLTNHKALLFSKEKDLFAFPVNLYLLNKTTEPSTSPQNTVTPATSTTATPAPTTVPSVTSGQILWPDSGVFSYQGAYVFGIDMEKGFILKSRITHQDNEDVRLGYNSTRAVKRIIYIGDKALYIIRWHDKSK